MRVTPTTYAVWSRISVAIAFLVPTIAWIVLNRSVWPFDPAWYGEVSVDLWLALMRKTNEWPLMCASAFGSKAPLIAWLGQFFVPLRHVTGSVESALLLLIAFAATYVLITTARVNRTLFHSTWSELIGMFTMLSAPLFIGLSHEYFAEMLQLAAVSYSIVVVVISRSRAELFFGLVAACCLGLLVKASSPLYMLMPCICSAIRLIRGYGTNTSNGRINIVAAALLAIIALGGTTVWYAHNLQTVRDFVASTSSGSIAMLYGSEAPLPTKLRFWALAFRSSFYAAHSLFWCAAVLFILALGARLIRRGRVTFSDAATVASTVQLLIAIYVFARQTNEETRYLLPLLPYSAVVSGFVVFELTAPLKYLFFTASFVGAVAVQLVAFDYDPVTVETPWLKSLDINAARSDTLIQVVKSTCSPGTSNQYNIIGVEYPWFNANSASFFMAKAELGQPYRCYYTSLGYAENDPARAQKRIEDMHPNAIAYPIDMLHRKTDPFNAVSESIEDTLLHDPKMHVVKIGMPPTAILFERQR